MFVNAEHYYFHASYLFKQDKHYLITKQSYERYN